MSKHRLLPVLLLWSAAGTAIADTVTVGSLAFGTVSWELELIKRDGLDRKYGFELNAQPLANPDAGKIGLKAGTLDLIVTDWIWVAQQSQAGSAYRFIPYSTQAGSLIASAQSSIKAVADLAGKRIGVVGGPLDKNWLLLRALAKQKAGLDLEHAATPVFGAPPLLEQELKAGRIDALLNFWHYAAKLEAQGYRRVLDGRDILAGLGIAELPPNIGYVFKPEWAAAQKSALEAFVKASNEARQSLCGNDESWKKIQAQVQETDPTVQASLRRGYCDGFVKAWDDAARARLAELYRILHETGGDAYTGASATLPATIFWTESPTR